MSCRLPSARRPFRDVESSREASASTFARMIYYAACRCAAPEIYYSDSAHIRGGAALMPPMPSPFHCST